MVLRAFFLTTTSYFILALVTNIWFHVKKYSQCRAYDRLPVSRIAQEALACWLKRKTAELMAKGYEEMAEEDRSYAETALEAQRETLKTLLEVDKAIKLSLDLS
jgi:hypothetical protein